MFKLLRYFSITSLVSILSAALVLGYLYHFIALNDLMELGKTQNITIAKSLSNANRKIIEELLTHDEDTSAQHLRSHKLSALESAIHQQLKNLRVLKVKIYRTSGHTAFSTNPDEIGQFEENAPEIRSAIAGNVTSQLEHNHKFHGFDGMLEHREALESYIPVYDSQGRSVIGVFEIYSDITPLVNRMRSTQWMIVLVVMVVLAMLYIALFVIVQHADRILRAQETQLRDSLSKLEESKDLLEERVVERTKVLAQEVREHALAQEQLRKLSAAVDQSPASVLITDAEGQIEYVNASFEQMSGHKRFEAIGKTPRILKSDEMSSAVYEEIWEIIRLGKDWRGELLNQRSDGTTYWVHATISPVTNSEGQITHYLGIEEDITEAKKDEERLRMAATVFQNAAEGIMITDAKGTILSVNPAFCRVTGYPDNEVLGQNSSILSSGRQDAAFYKTMWTALSEEGEWQGEIWNRRKNGEFYQEWLHISSIKDYQGNLSSFIGVFSDITKIRQTEERLNYLSNFDALTGLPNKVLLHDRLKQSIAHAHRQGSKMAVLFMDLDRFNNVNETLGHPVGDLLLKAVAERLTQVVHEDDTVARFGGDEFAIILDSIGEVEDTAIVAELVQEQMRKPFEIDNNELFLDGSIGISIYPSDGTDMDTLLRHADSAMYHAIEQGGGNYQFFTQDLNKRARNRLSMEKNLRYALERDEFDLYYQPQVEIDSGVVVGVEALLRWHHPELGNISPGEFIPLAEETGMIIPLGEWALATACATGTHIQSLGLPALRMGVNLSAKQFETEGLLDIIQTQLDKSGLQPEFLELELTEGIIMHNAHESINTLNEIHRMGVKLSIDDFGTGYSSLSYLKRFPLHTLKIDQSFVRDIPEDQDDAAIVKAIIAMAQSLELRIIAEGVTTKDQLAFLQKLGCDEIQGYLYSPPLSLPELIEYLRAGNELSNTL